MEVDLLLENLIKILEFEKRYYLKLIEISTKKTDIIIKGSINELQAITEQEQQMIGQVKKGEDARTLIIEQLAKIYRIKTEELSISQLMEKIGKTHGRHKDKLGSVKLSFKRSIEELRRINEVNGKLIKNALEYIDFSINLLTDTSMGNVNYSGIGQEKRMAGRSLLDFKL